ncbi:hypothetical protein B0T18DRAFT_167361 [Schizothecium vesticola]|uniref:Uncharacterized protein n=1 Tax=Schizothecium vesticola TaxID=314040 RepID=A0AA40ENJ6_9PEZI|nr:hypothetical protein B0T18DRAFT_167361 [Schizothecium vesticola]
MPDKPKHKYPGWDLDLGWQGFHDYPAGIYLESHGSHSEMICVREVAMMLAMDRLSDKPDWHIKVFDEDIAAKWRAEIMAWPDDELWNRISNFQPWWLDLLRDNEDGNPWRREPVPCPEGILNDEAADYCILELREKAEHFKRTGIVPTLDATFTVVKSDALIPGDLHEALRLAFAKLQADQAACPDWHPNTNEMVQVLVHPSMYPLVYGRSRFLEDEAVGIDDAVDRWAGKGEVIPRKYHVASRFCSTDHQWLPANLEFTAMGGVKFTSYINNLHPTKYRDIYGTIEKLVEKSLPLWDHCLAEYRETRPGRQEPRLRPGDASDDNKDNWDPPSWREMLARRGQGNGPLEGDRVQKPRELVEEWCRIRKPVQIKPPVFGRPEVNYTVDPGKPLGQKFKDSGLQIMVKMASIELTPEKPEFPPGGWHVEGQMNEHIIATALYYLDSENITESCLEFRAQTDRDQDHARNIGQDAFHWMESIYGVKLGSGPGSSCLQSYGSVVTREGRLLAFPNIFHHRVSGFKLADASKPGHRRFIALWLVNPTIRVINTGNIPPQQAEWWEESTFGTLRGEGGSSAMGTSASLPPEIAVLLLEHGLGKGHLDAALERGLLGALKLPNELLDMVRNGFGDGLPMSRGEAEEHRLKLMEERSAFKDGADEAWNQAAYSFCEH